MRKFIRFVGAALILLFFAANAKAESLQKPVSQFEKHFTVEQNLRLVLEKLPFEVLVEVSSGAEAILKSNQASLPEGVELEFSGSTLRIAGAKSLQSGNSKVQISSGEENLTVTSRGGSRIVVIDGEVVTAEGEGLEIEEKPAVKLSLAVPSGTNVEAKNIKQLLVEAPLGSLKLEMSSASKAEITEAHSVVLKASGTARARIKKANSVEAVLSGVSLLDISEFSKEALQAKLSGTSRLKCNGKYQEISITTSGASRSNTTGPVSGVFNATASGASAISHKGAVEGEITRNRSGAARIRLH